jgi:hypothetical protein
LWIVDTNLDININSKLIQIMIAPHLCRVRDTVKYRHIKENIDTVSRTIYLDNLRTIGIL